MGLIKIVKNKSLIHKAMAKYVDTKAKRSLMRTAEKYRTLPINSNSTTLLSDTMDYSVPQYKKVDTDFNNVLQAKYIGKYQNYFSSAIFKNQKSHCVYDVEPIKKAQEANNIVEDADGVFKIVAKYESKNKDTEFQCLVDSVLKK